MSVFAIRITASFFMFVLCIPIFIHTFSRKFADGMIRSFVIGFIFFLPFILTTKLAPDAGLAFSAQLYDSVIAFGILVAMLVVSNAFCSYAAQVWQKFMGKPSALPRKG